MQRVLNFLESQVWDMHMAGMPMSAICETTKMDPGFVRATIVSIWRDDCKVMRSAA